MRYDYIKRLIEGTREMAEENMNKYHGELRKKYPECMSGQYLDGAMLASVVENDLLPLLANDFDKQINAVNLAIDNALLDDRIILADELNGVIKILESLKETTRGVASE